MTLSKPTLGFLSIYLKLNYFLLFDRIYSCSGAVAQLGERLVRNEEVASSILVSSTIKYAWQSNARFFVE